MKKYTHNRSQIVEMTVKCNGILFDVIVELDTQGYHSGLFCSNLYGLDVKRHGRFSRVETYIRHGNQCYSHPCSDEAKKVFDHVAARYLRWEPGQEV